MREETQISMAATKAYGSKYDEAVKEVFLNKEILAPVLKIVVPEFKNCTVEKIISYMGDGEVTSDPVDSASIMAGQLPTEMNSIGEKLVRFDSHFKVINPMLTNKSIKVYLHIDLEVQNDYKPKNPEYPIIKRGIYYGAREISSQLGILTEKTNYDDIEKVYSIWICNERVPQELQNTVTSYSIVKKDEIGITNEPAEDYDLMTVIIIRRGRDECNAEIFDYLKGVFENNIDKVNGYVNIKENEQVTRGMRKMEGLGQSLAEKNYKKGLETGLKQGIERGREESQEIIDEKDRQLTETKTELTETQTELTETKTELTETKVALSEKDRQLAESRKEIERLKALLESK